MTKKSSHITPKLTKQAWQVMTRENCDPGPRVSFPSNCLLLFIPLTWDLFFSYCFPLLQETAIQQTVRMQS